MKMYSDKNLKSPKSMLINSVQQERVIQTKGARILSLGSYKGLFGFILIQGDFVISIFTFVIARCDVAKFYLKLKISPSNRCVLQQMVTALVVAT